MADIPNAYGGFPLACFPVDQDGNPIPGLPGNPYDNIWRRFAAQILCEQYSDPQKAYDRFVAFLGPGYTVFRVDNSSSVTPGTLIGSNGLHLWVFVSGTTNEVQLATQAFESLKPPTDFGGYETLPVWNSAAIEVAKRIKDTGLGETPHCIFVGHSFGGVLVELLSWWYARADQHRIVFSLTFATPPAGRIPSRGPYPNNIIPCALLNNGDPIGFFPPPSPFIEWAFPLIGPDVYVAWKLWKPSRGVVRIARDGTRKYDDSIIVAWFDLTAYILQAIGNLPLDPGNDHYMREYVRRLWLPFVPPTPCGLV